MPLVLSLIGQRRGVSAVEKKKKKSVTYPTDATRLPNSLVAVLAVGISLSLSLSVPPSPTLSAKKAVRVGFADHKRNSGKTYGTGMTEKHPDTLGSRKAPISLNLFYLIHFPLSAIRSSLAAVL